jgi:membrane associated rhomboid family serine protease
MDIYQLSHYHKRSLFEKLSVTWWLIILNSVLFIIFYSLISAGVLLWSEVGLVPSLVLQGQNLWTFLTSMFMHASLEHILFNMISLFFVGMLLEKIIGRRRYFWFYLIAGLFAGLIFALLSGFFGYSTLGAELFGNPIDVGVGASGAIFGLVGVLAVLIPSKKISLVAGPLFVIILESFLGSVYPNSTLVASLGILFTVYIFVSIFAIFSFDPRLYKISLPIEMPFWAIPILAIIPLVIVGLFIPLPIGNSAHFGGLLIGLTYGFYLRKKYPNKVSMLSRQTLLR